MHRLVTTTAALGLLASAAVATPLLSDASPRVVAGRTLTYTLVLDESSLVADDVDPAGTSPGDRYVFAATLRQRGSDVGRLLGTTTAVDATYQGVLQQYTLLLPGGSLEVQGGGTSLRVPGTVAPAKQRAAVVGGTGTYSGARGTYAVEDLSDTRQRVTITLR